MNETRFDKSAEAASGHGGKATVSAPANIAFIKYWGARDLARAIPYHPSISMTLTACRSVSTVEHRPDAARHEILLAHEGLLAHEDIGPATGRPTPAPPRFAERVEQHLERLKAWAGAPGAFKVVTANSFPSAAGLASSASGFAALTLATAAALGIELTGPESSALARSSGSGSASRSVFGGYVEWPAQAAPGQEEEEATSYAVQLAGADHWRLADVIALVETGPKEVSSLDGHRLATTSPHFATRLQLVPQRLETLRQALTRRDMETLGRLVEEDAIELHLIAMSSRPAIFYWKPASLAVLEAVRDLRRQGLAAYSTLDAGANVHVICPEEQEDAVAARLEEVPGVFQTIRDRVGDGPRREEKGLF